MKTYVLKKRKDRKTIRDWFGTWKAQSPTYYGKAMAGSVSARGLHFASTITYRLWEGNGRISISKRFSNLQAQSLTPCGKAMAGSASARGSAFYKHNHLHTVGRQWQDQHQQGGQQFTSTIAYSLWESNGRVSISKGVCTLQAQSLTYCGKAMAGSASARGSALCKHNHLLAVGRQWEDQHQQGSLHFASTITYNLWEGNGGINISKKVCT